MALNNREISNKVRVYHRYLGFFLTGIMFMYALSGITLTFRDKEYFKKEVFIEKMHKATSSKPLYFLNVFFGVALLFFVFSSYWMFLPQTDIFRKAIYFTLGGIAISLLMILI